MPESWSESYDDKLDLHTITPARARQDHWNTIQDFLVFIWQGDDDAAFCARLASHGVTRMQTFSERFPADKCPGAIEGQPDNVVERFDQIATEVTALIQSEGGGLTIQKIEEIAAEMRQLCYQ